MNNYCVYLNLPIALFKDGFDAFRLPKVRHFKLNKTILSDDLENWFIAHNLSVYLVEVFYTPPDTNGGIHIDSVSGDYTKLNWQFGGKDSVMNWYSETSPNARKHGVTKIGSKNIALDKDAITKIHSQCIQNPSLIQVGIPHNIENFLEDRWVVSVVYKYPSAIFRRPTWTESLSIFNEYLIK